MEQEYGMKWYKFMIYFALFAGAVINAITALLVFTGALYSMEGVSPETVYEVFPSLKPVDIIYGIFLIAMAVLLIFTRFSLAKFKKNGPMFLYLVYGINFVATVIYCLVMTVILETNMFDISNIANIAMQVVMLIVNLVYFRKRKSLFIY